MKNAIPSVPKLFTGFQILQIDLHDFWIDLDLITSTKLDRGEKEDETEVNSKTMQLHLPYLETGKNF